MLADLLRAQWYIPAATPREEEQGIWQFAPACPIDPVVP